MMDRVDTMKVLIRLGANVNECNNTGSTPLHAASLNGYGPSMELLVEKGAEMDAKNIYSYSPINYADSNSRGHSPIYNHVNTVEYVPRLSTSLPLYPLVYLTNFYLATAHLYHFSRSSDEDY